MNNKHLEILVIRSDVSVMELHDNTCMLFFSKLVKLTA